MDYTTQLVTNIFTYTLSPSTYLHQPKIINTTGMLLLEDNALTGIVPTEIQTLPLTQLYLGFNNYDFAGRFPNIIIPTLQILNLKRCNIDGAIPANFFTIVTTLKQLHLDGNAIDGPVLMFLTMLTTLESLTMKNTGLTGAIPTEMGGMTDMITLDLSGNGITGVIPTEVGRMINLQTLDVSGKNGITGVIPTEMGEVIDMRTLNLSGNKIDGGIPTELGRLENMSTWLMMRCWKE